MCSRDEKHLLCSMQHVHAVTVSAGTALNTMVFKLVGVRVLLFRDSSIGVANVFEQLF